MAINTMIKERSFIIDSVSFCYFPSPKAEETSPMTNEIDGKSKPAQIAPIVPIIIKS
jgi:hypothetical protein